jgi:hypothetical protein
MVRDCIRVDARLQAPLDLSFPPGRGATPATALGAAIQDHLDLLVAGHRAHQCS